MKKVIRREVWETNSSTSHSCVIMTEEQHNKWEKENLYYFNYNFYNPFKDLPKDKQPVRGALYTQDEVLEFHRLQGYEYNPDEYIPDDYDEYDTDESKKDKFIKEMGDFSGYNAWDDDEYLEFDDCTYTTPSGEIIVVECKYGNDY